MSFNGKRRKETALENPLVTKLTIFSFNLHLFVLENSDLTGMLFSVLALLVKKDSFH